MGKKSSPPPPDYRAAAEETSAGNVALVNAQTKANRPDQYTPWGSSTWNKQGDNWTQNIKLSPQQQSALNSQFRVQKGRSDMAENIFPRVGNELGRPMNWGKFPDYQFNIGSGDKARNQAIDANYAQATSRLDPMWSQREESKEAALRNQGLRPGDEAYENAIDNMGRERNDAYNNAMYSAIREGGVEGRRVFDMNKDAAAFKNLGRQSLVAEEMQKRGFTLNEMNALLTGQQVNAPNMPSFAQAGVAQGPDYLNAANMGHQAALDAYSTSQSGLNSLMSAGASAAFMFSDIRLKRNVKKVGSYKGHNVYSWDYIWGEHATGVMAHEMPPEYLAVHPSGYLMVNYGAL